MAHHLMAVCVVCLLCADHLPCKEHVLVPTKSISNKVANSLSSSDGAGLLTVATDIPGNYLYDKRKDDVTLVRSKRHGDHHELEKHHHTQTPEVTKVYIKKLFRQFSNRNTNTMNVDEFEKMMLQLDLKKLVSEPSQAENSTCMNGLEFLERMTDVKHEEVGHEHHHEHDDHEHQHHSTFRERIKIEAEHMLSMCPILLYQIINRQSPLELNGCLNSSNFITSELAVDDELSEMAPRSKVWLYSTLSIIGVSLCGLLGVAVIPIMEKHFYHHVLQFLVALAVGTLAGDALLHLLPHAMMPTYEGQDIHQMMMFRGLAAVGGIVFFYFFERFLTMVTEWRQRKQKRDKPSSRVRVMRDPESVSLNNGAATCKHKYSSYPYCYDEIAMETKDDHHEHQHVVEGGGVLNNHVDKLKHHHDDLSILTPTDGKKMNGTILDHAIDTDNNTLSTSVDEGSIESSALCNNNKNTITTVALPVKKDSLQEESYTIILR